MASALSPIATLLVTLSATLLGAQQAPSSESAKVRPKGETKTETTVKAKTDEPAKAKTSSDEEPTVTHHHVHIDGKDLAYTATVGLMPIKDSKGDLEARIFFMAYTQDNTGAAAARPLMFSFNGGPGSASVWLHLGALGRGELPCLKSRAFPPLHFV